MEDTSGRSNALKRHVLSIAQKVGGDSRRNSSKSAYEETVLEGFCCFDPQKPMRAPGEHSEFELLERHPFATTILSDHHEDSGARHYPRLGFEQAEQPQ